ncbi:hypothetical protein VLK31_25640 [Variovorax sp. H27-G14]|uniref:hypothetical protein n=1 Tax=Variovorax sp. H27-G14 TaxID=3111914 RepID=UPI0038FC6DE6
MFTSPTDQIVIMIDDEIESLIRDIESAPQSTHRATLVEDLQSTVLDAVLGPFGVSSAMFKDVDGGNITTLHNFEKGVTANESDRARHEDWEAAQTSSFDRTDYDAQSKAQRKPQFSAHGPIHDRYTGKELPKDGQAQRDHVVSAHEIEMSSKGHLAQDCWRRPKFDPPVRVVPLQI